MLDGWGSRIFSENISAIIRNTIDCGRSSAKSSMICSTAAPHILAAMSIAATIAVPCESPTIHAATATAPPGQHMPRERWLEKHRQEILKTAYQSARLRGSIGGLTGF